MARTLLSFKDGNQRIIIDFPARREKGDRVKVAFRMWEDKTWTGEIKSLAPLDDFFDYQMNWDQKGFRFSGNPTEDQESIRETGLQTIVSFNFRIHIGKWQREIEIPDVRVLDKCIWELIDPTTEPNKKKRKQLQKNGQTEYNKLYDAWRKTTKLEGGKWTEYTDPVSLDTFWHNSTTGESCWNKPAEWHYLEKAYKIVFAWWKNQVQKRNEERIKNQVQKRKKGTTPLQQGPDPLRF